MQKGNAEPKTTNKSHDDKPIVIEDGNEYGFKNENSFYRGTHLYLMGIVAWHDHVPLALNRFLKENNVNLRVHKEEITLSGDFYLTRSKCLRYLEKQYGDVVTAYIKQAEACFAHSNDAGSSSVIKLLMESALTYPLTIEQKAKAHLYLAQYYNSNEDWLNATIHYFNAQSLSTSLETPVFLEEHNGKLTDCQRRNGELTFSESLNIGADLRCSGSISMGNGKITFEGRVFYKGIIIRDAKPSMESMLLTDLGFQISGDNDKLSMSGPLTPVPVQKIIDLMRAKHGDLYQYCFNEATACLEHFNKSGMVEELMDAQWLLQKSLLCTKDSINTAKSHLYLGNVERLKNEFHLARTYYRLAIANVTDLKLNTAVSDISSEMSNFQYLPSGSALDSDNVQNIERLKEAKSIVLQAIEEIDNEPNHLTYQVPQSSPAIPAEKEVPLKANEPGSPGESNVNQAGSPGESSASQAGSPGEANVNQPGIPGESSANLPGSPGESSANLPRRPSEPSETPNLSTSSSPITQNVSAAGARLFTQPNTNVPRENKNEMVSKVKQQIAAWSADTAKHKYFRKAYSSKQLKDESIVKWVRNIAKDYVKHKKSGRHPGRKQRRIMKEIVDFCDQSPNDNDLLSKLFEQVKKLEERNYNVKGSSARRIHFMINLLVSETDASYEGVGVVANS